MVVAILGGCAGSATVGERTPAAAPAFPFREARLALVARINQARAAAGLGPLRYQTLLERIGDAHCAALIADGTTGHFSTDGVPPYLRYLLAGGVGFHRENVASLSVNYTLAPADVEAFLASSLASMLAEKPPADGHRRTLLDADVTAIGIGLAVAGGELRVAHELAVDGCRRAVPPPRRVPPSTTVTLEAALAAPWRFALVEIRREPMPQPFSRAAANARAAYQLPARVAVLPDRTDAGRRGGFPVGEALRTGPGESFSLRWFTGPTDGVELVVVWATKSAAATQLAAVASFAMVVTAAPELPPPLARYAALAAELGAAAGDALRRWP